jgi:uncharacterized protein (TIGR04255 family)
MLTEGILMASRGKPIPKKLKHDAIVEAILEIRFQTATIPEVLFGRLADYAPWKGFFQSRLPAYDLPAPLRASDPNLRFQPLFALSNGQRTVRIGSNVISYHRAAPYGGWEIFYPEIEETITGLFEKAETPIIQRLGLRYLNSLRTDLHGIVSICDLALQISAANEQISGNVNLNFSRELTQDTAATVRIATPEFVQGVLPKTSVYIDVDVFTKDQFQTTKKEDVQVWIKAAHESEKGQFFGLLTDDKIEELKEE